MALSDDQVKLIRDSYCLIKKCGQAYSDNFYHRLFLQHPFIRALFPDDLASQSSVFMQTIDVLIAEADHLDNIILLITDLANRHIKYGVKIEHYALVGEVLIETFERILEERFTLATRRAWEALYAETSKIMINEAHGGSGFQTGLS